MRLKGDILITLFLFSYLLIHVLETHSLGMWSELFLKLHKSTALYYFKLEIEKNEKIKQQA